MSVKEQATRSVFWSAVERFSAQAVQFSLSIIIARILSPSDYGTIAMLSIFMAIAQTFIDSGFAIALIQKKNKTEADYSTVFYFNIIVAIVTYLLLYFSSPFIADFYNMEILDKITKAFGLTLIISSFGIVQQARLTIALDFKKQAYASLIAITVSGIIGIIMAYTGYGVWALVYQALFNSFLNVACMWIFSKWLPKLIFSLQSFRQLFGFGSKLLLSTLLHTVYTNIYTLIIGKLFASSELGYYNRSLTIAQLPSINLTNVIVRAIYPIQCRMQDDMEQLNDFFLKYLRMSCYIIFPVMVALCALSQPLIITLLTSKWLPAAPMLQLLSLAFLFEPIMRINHNMLNVKGRTDYFLYAEIIKKIVAVLILVITIPFGVYYMCAGLVAYSIADIIIIVHYSKKITRISLLTQFRALFPIFILTFSMGSIMYLITLIHSISPLLQLCIASILGTCYFIFISWIFQFKELKIIISSLQNLIKSKRQ